MARSRCVIWLVIVTALIAVVWYKAFWATRPPVSLLPSSPPDDVETVFQLVSELGFGSSKDLNDWRESSFVGYSKYSLETDEEGGTFLKASSKDTCSGIFKEIKVPMKYRPFLSWEWRVTKFPSNKKDGTSLTEKSDCDFGARVCAVFAGDTPFSSHYLYYVWDDRFKEGTHASSSGSLKRTNILVVEDSAGGDGSGWVFERRDVIKDYRKLFGTYPKQAFSFVGILTDSDGTHTDSAAEFRNVRIYKEVLVNNGQRAPAPEAAHSGVQDE